jgi:hypothetical protein
MKRIIMKPYINMTKKNFKWGQNIIAQLIEIAICNNELAELAKCKH